VQPALAESSEQVTSVGAPSVVSQKIEEISPYDAQIVPKQIRKKGRRLAISMFAWMLVLVVGAAFVIAVRRPDLIKQFSNVDENKVTVAAPTGPSSKTTELEVQQRMALGEASKQIATNDLDTAKVQLQKAAALNGPLTEELQKRISEIDASKNDPHLRQLRQREEQLWQKALKSADAGRYMEAEKGLRQILQLGPGKLHRDDAQTYLEKVIPQHLEELDLVTQARLDLAQDEFQSARSIAAQLVKKGSNPSALVAEIDEKERARMAQLEKQYNDLSARDGDEVVLKLNALWPKFQELAAAGGPMSGEALDYVNKIPETVVSLQARMKQKDTDSLFDRTVQAYRQAIRISDKAGLTAARINFQSIVSGGGSHAQEAQTYLDEVGKKLAVSSQSPAVPGVSPTRDRDNAVRAAMQLYVAAFEQRNVDALRQIWPNIGSQYESFKLWFENAQSIHIQLQIQSMQFDSDGTTATVKVLQTREYTATDSKAVRMREPESFQLSKLNGSWVITDVDANF
jgi:hypothetical protein